MNIGGFGRGGNPGSVRFPGKCINLPTKCGKLVRAGQQRQQGRKQLDPLSLECPGQTEVCCRGECQAGPGNTRHQRRAGSARAAAGSPLCPADFTGLRPLPGLCDQFAECFKGRAIRKVYQTR